jgi:hypothetical protein
MMPEAIFNMSALIINVKRPRLNMLMGRVNNIAMGLKTAFKMPSTAAAKSAEKKLLT